MPAATPGLQRVRSKDDPDSGSQHVAIVVIGNYRMVSSGMPMTDRPEDGPDFLIIGAQKAGTTSCFEYLIQHPGVAPPLKKEIHFFDVPERFRRGAGWYRAFFPVLAERHRGSTSRRITGEASPYYLFHPRVPERVAELFPRVKLLALLRNPADRAYSQYQMWVRAGREPLSFEAAIDAEPERLRGTEEQLLTRDDYCSPVHRRHSYLARGIYVDQLLRWSRHFSQEQMLVLKAEDLLANPASTVGEVITFLGLPPVELDVSERYNARSYPPLAPATRRRLLEYFEPHNRRLYDLLGRDFGWH